MPPGVLNRDSTEVVKEGMLKKLILGKTMVTGTLGRGICEKFRYISIYIYRSFHLVHLLNNFKVK